MEDQFIYMQDEAIDLQILLIKASPDEQQD